MERRSNGAVTSPAKSSRRKSDNVALQASEQRGKVLATLQPQSNMFAGLILSAEHRRRRWFIIAVQSDLKSLFPFPEWTMTRYYKNIILFALSLNPSRRGSSMIHPRRSLPSPNASPTQPSFPLFTQPTPARDPRTVGKSGHHESWYWFFSTFSFFHGTRRESRTERKSSSIWNLLFTCDIELDFAQ